ncbi:MAG: sensor histidine kinase [Candidatus Limnocylindrales bacterium]
MPRSLTARIVLAFLGVAFVAWFAIGATLFVLLRGLHTQTLGSRLEDQVSALAVQLRQATIAGDTQTLLAGIRDELPTAGVDAYIVTADGRVVSLSGTPTLRAGTFAVDPGGRGSANHGVTAFPDGRTYVYAATVIRPGVAAGPRALVLATPDTAGRDALGDLVATVPIVVVVTLLVGAPLAWLVARSVGAPLRRLAAATADVPTTSPIPPLPLDGPTEVRDLIVRFNAMTETLAQTRDRETELLANLRHDLRTPLTVIGGFADALADGTATGEDAGRAARAIAEESARLERLVGELGAIERLRAGAAGLRPEPLDGGALIEEATARFAPGAASVGITVSAVRPESPESAAADLGFVADRLAVDRMLGNLVSNALAVAPSPGGHVWLEARRIGPSFPGDAGSVALSVTDDGPGFPPGATERVFERFFRADPARSGGGSGLGLAIVRELAAAHGGSAHAEQVAPRGARVSVVLPKVPRPAV